MPVTKTAKRALRSSKRKQQINTQTIAKMEIEIRKANESPTQKNIKSAISSVDIAAKKKVIHKNKAANIKSRLSKLNKDKSK